MTAHITKDGYLYEAVDTLSGAIVWACWKRGDGICGYGRTDREALEDYLDKCDEFAPEDNGKVDRAVDDELDRGELQ